MKFYVAELVATGIAFLCALTNHAGACFLWRKLMPLDLWASNIMDRRGVNQIHRFAPPPATFPRTCNCHSNPRLSMTGGLGAAAVSYHYCPDHGMVRDA